jgi:hypothetical protein
MARSILTLIGNIAALARRLNPGSVPLPLEIAQTVKYKSSASVNCRRIEEGLSSPEIFKDLGGYLSARVTLSTRSEVVSILPMIFKAP